MLLADELLWMQARPSRSVMHVMKMKIRSKSHHGFSLVEAMVTTALVGIVFVALYTGIAQGFGLLANAREDLRANQILLDKMEEMRLYSWDQINSFGTANSFVPNKFTEDFFPSGTNSTRSTFSTDSNRQDGSKNTFRYYGTIMITNVNFTNSYSSSLRKVSVTLTWTNGAKVYNHEMSTFVSEYGLQKHIY